MALPMIISFREYGDRSLGCDGSRCLGRRWLTGLAVFVVVFESLTVLVLRAHYTMDVFTGMVTGLYAAHLANHISTSPKTTTSELPAGNVTILRVPPGDIRAAKFKCPPRTWVLGHSPDNRPAAKPERKPHSGPSQVFMNSLRDDP